LSNGRTATVQRTRFRTSVLIANRGGTQTRRDLDVVDGKARWHAWSTLRTAEGQGISSTGWSGRSIIRRFEVDEGEVVVTIRQLRNDGAFAKPEVESVTLTQGGGRYGDHIVAYDPKAMTVTTGGSWSPSFGHSAPGTRPMYHFEPAKVRKWVKTARSMKHTR
jgi:hypothetical protein